MIILLFRRYVDECDDLADAIAQAWATQEYSDDDWFDRIEVIDADGMVRILTDQSPEFVAYGAQREEERRARERTDPPKQHVGNVMVDGRALQSFYGPDGDAEMTAEYERLRPYLGERVTIAPVKRRW